MTVYVSLFRAINVGGKRKVKMADLVALHAALGFHSIASYIQSGNVIFQSDDSSQKHIQSSIEESFATTCGFHSDVLLRSFAEIEQIIAQSPFQQQTEKDPKRLAVMFLAHHPADEDQEALHTGHKGPEEIVISQKEMYIYYPDGVGNSKLTNALIEKKLRTISTGRNWNTVLKLRELMLT